MGSWTDAWFFRTNKWMNEWVEHNIVKDIKLNSFIHSFVLHNQATVQLPINPISIGLFFSRCVSGGGLPGPNFIFWIARLTDDPLKWAYTLWKSIVLRIPKSTRPFRWVVWELSNSRSKSINFIAKNTQFSRGEKSRLKKIIFYFL